MSQVITINKSQLIGVKTFVFTIFNQEKYDAKAIPGAWQEFFSRAAGTDLLKTEFFYGASIPNMSMDAPMEYFAGVLVDENAEVPSGFEVVDIPAGNYLSHLHTGPISNIATSYQKAYMETLPNSGNQMRPAPHLEIYVSDKDPMAEDYQMEIGIPID